MWFCSCDSPLYFQTCHFPFCYSSVYPHDNILLYKTCIQTYTFSLQHEDLCACLFFLSHTGVAVECLKGRSFGAYRITCEIIVKLRLLQSRSLNIQIWYSNASILFLKPLWILIQLNCWNKSVIKVYSYLHKEHLFWLHFMSA